jgi:hypothetical protein
MRGRRLPAVVLVAVLIAASSVGAGTSSAGAVTVTTWVAQRSCGRAAPGHASCFALRLVRATARTAGATLPVRTQPALASGPHGGYTPGQLATAYGINPDALAAATQTVAVVDAYDDPTVKADLAAFDAHYGLPAETATSFRIVNQAGAAAPLPSPDSGWAGETTLDVQAVRGVCHKCKILLVEATSSTTVNLASAVNEAALLHATEISNSYGGIETYHSAATDAKYNHPGIVITASTGDDGWYGWDVLNDGTTPDGVAQVPAALNTVVGVGGTSLYLNPNGTRASETVWNSNGPHDALATLAHTSLGAAGGGCSTLFAPRRWQQFVAGYGTLGCAPGKRSVTDIAAVADPLTGYDVFQTYPGAGAWATYGGTSLASPVIAAMWALAGGARGVAYPALTLYGHYRHDLVRPTYDVTVGGTGACSTASAVSCANFFSGNPNALGAGLIDCGFPANGAGTLANHGQCYAQPGYDGVAGVGTPKGVATFAPLGPAAVIGPPGLVTHGVAKRFTGLGSSDPFPGGAITSYAWNWGDGTTSSGPTPVHKYSAKATRTITLTVTDNYGRRGIAKRTIVVR